MMLAKTAPARQISGTAEATAEALGSEILRKQRAQNRFSLSFGINLVACLHPPLPLPSLLLSFFQLRESRLELALVREEHFPSSTTGYLLEYADVVT